MAEIKRVFDTLGMSPDDCKRYMEGHNAVPQKVASVLTMRARGKENCDHMDAAINEAKEFIKKTASKLDPENTEFYLDFGTASGQLSDAQREVFSALQPVFLGHRLSMLMDELNSALSKFCQKFTKEQIEAAVAE